MTSPEKKSENPVLIELWCHSSGNVFNGEGCTRDSVFRTEEAESSLRNEHRARYCKWT